MCLLCSPIEAGRGKVVCRFIPEGEDFVAGKGVFFLHLVKRIMRKFWNIVLGSQPRNCKRTILQYDRSQGTNVNRRRKKIDMRGDQK